MGAGIKPVRMLFTFVAGEGHFRPLVPIARAAAAAGHRIAFGCAPAMLPVVRGEGFEAHPIGQSAPERGERLPLLPPDRERDERHLRERFVRVAARYRVPLVVALVRRWRPDVLVCDETDFGAMIAAECCALPHATLLVIAAGGFVRADVVGEAWNALRREHGLVEDGHFEGPSRYLVLSPFPPSYRDPADPLPWTGHAYSPARRSMAGEPAPAWARAAAQAPTLYLTFGTIFNVESGDLLARVLAWLRELELDLFVTVGRQIDPAELGPQPAHVHVEGFVDQDRVLPYCDLVVCHGGSGSVMGALAHGLASVLIPIGADQALNADRCAARGVARVLDPMTLTRADLHGAVRAVLADPAHARCARRLRDEMASLPGPEHGVTLLERLARERQPIPFDPSVPCRR